MSATAALSGLFEEARRRARRRRRVIAALLAVSTVSAVVVALARDRGGGPTMEGAESPAAVAPQKVLARQPYMGVACRRANSIGCDRVGVAVWVRGTAEAVRATIAGRTIRLDDREWSVPDRGMFAGFVRHAGLRGSGPLAVQAQDGRWRGPPVEVPVRLVITFADGKTRETVVRVALAPGWG